MLTDLKYELERSYNDLVIAEPSLAAELDTALTSHGVTLTSDEQATPMRSVPIVLIIIDEARLDEAIASVTLSGIGAAAAVRALGRPEAVTPAALAALATATTISAPEAEGLGRAVERYLLSNDDTGLVTAIGAAAGSLTNAELAGWTAAKWLTELSGWTPPPGVTLAPVATMLSGRLQALYPASAWLGRLPAVVEADVEDDLDTTEVLLAKNAQRFGRPFSKLDVSDVSGGALSAVTAAWMRLSTLTGSYGGLGLGAIFDDTGETTAARAAAAVDRIDAMVGRIDAAGTAAPRTDLLLLDLSTGSAAWDRFSLSAIATALRPVVKGAVTAYQRMRTVGGDLDTAQVLMRGGFTSATQIARMRRAAFVEVSELDGDTAIRVWEAARRLGTDAAVYASAVVDQLAGASDPPATQSPRTVGQKFTALDGYASVFGNQSFCDCKHCMSVLGPAAYFVDLMEFVKQEVGSQLEVDDPLALKTRRPDLWTTPLTCEASNALVPTLTIVNEVLENDIAARTSYGGSWDDRGEIETHVYQTKLLVSEKSFVQPFARGLEHVSAALETFGVSWASIGDTLGIGGGSLRRMVLGLPMAWEFLLSNVRNRTQLEAIYGLTFVETVDGLERVEGTVLAAAMGTDRAGLSALLNSWFVGQSSIAPGIVAAQRGPHSVQNDIEWVEPLTVEALDRMHRLARWADVRGYAVAVVDRELRAANDATLNYSTFDRAVGVAILGDRIGMALDEDDTIALGATADQGIFDRRFNRGVRNSADLWPSSTTPFTHPAFVPGGTVANPGWAARLAGGLGLSNAATVALIRLLAPILARESQPWFDPDSATESERHFLLTAANLGRLYRHARLLQLLRLGVDDLAELMRLMGLSPNNDISGSLTLARGAAAWRASGRTLDQLAVAGGFEPRASVEDFEPVATVAAIRASGGDTLTIPDGFFSAPPLRLTPGASFAVITANPTWFETLHGRRVIRRSIDHATETINVPSGHTETASELRSMLLAALRVKAGDALTISDAIFTALPLRLTPEASREVIDANPDWFETLADGRRVIKRSIDPATEPS